MNQIKTGVNKLLPRSHSALHKILFAPCNLKYLNEFFIDN